MKVSNLATPKVKVNTTCNSVTMYTAAISLVVEYFLEKNLIVVAVVLCSVAYLVDFHQKKLHR